MKRDFGHNEDCQHSATLGLSTLYPQGKPMIRVTLLALIPIASFATGKPEAVAPASQASADASSDASASSLATVDAYTSSGSWSEANGGAGGQSTSNATGGANSLSVSYRDRLQAPGLGIAPVYASHPCALGWSAGVSIPGGALGGGKARVDAGCERRELARVIAPLNPSLALRVLCADPIVAAVARPGDCEYVTPVVAVPAQPVAPPVDLSAYATKEEVARAFKTSVSK